MPFEFNDHIPGAVNDAQDFDAFLPDSMEDDMISDGRFANVLTQVGTSFANRWVLEYRQKVLVKPFEQAICGAGTIASDIQPCQVQVGLGQRCNKVPLIRHAAHAQGVRVRGV